jgi:hypothetical protein
MLMHRATCVNELVYRYAVIDLDGEVIDVVQSINIQP